MTAVKGSGWESRMTEVNGIAGGRAGDGSQKKIFFTGRRCTRFTFAPFKTELGQVTISCYLAVRARAEVRRQKLAYGGVPHQNVTISMAEGLMVTMARVSQHGRQCPRGWVIGLIVTRHPSHALARSFIIMPIFGE